MNNHSKFFKYWYIVAEILFVVISISAGFILGDDDFKLSIALTIYMSSIPLTAILHAIYAHLENQEEQIKLLREIVNNTHKVLPFNTHQSEESEITILHTSSHKWRCSSCGKLIDKEPCKFCGSK